MIKTTQLDLAGRQLPQIKDDCAPLPDALPDAKIGPLIPGTMLAERYYIVRALKAGGMGAVYLATDSSQPGRCCAVKEMLDHFSSLDEREDGQDWFRREATMLASFQHRYIPQIFDYFIEQQRYYLVMEYIDGENLEDLLLHHGRPGLPEPTVLNLASQICEVLAYLHNLTPPVIFRDLKPANVMLTNRGEIRLVDFGIARSFSVVRGNSLVGTPGYAPMEQYQGLSDELSDLFSLGATMHHLLTGCDPRAEPPFSFKPVRFYVPAISRATECLLEGLLQKDAANRGPRLGECARQVHRIAADLAQGLVPAVIGTPITHPPGGQMPPTRMVLPVQSIDFGRRARGQRHTASIPISNEGKTELRVMLAANVPWLHAPTGQLRVPPTTSVEVPLEIDASHLPAGTSRGRIELDGNGGAKSVPVQVEVGASWSIDGAGALMIAGISLIVVLSLVVGLLLTLH